MGERGAIQVHYSYGSNTNYEPDSIEPLQERSEGSVYLYTHWTGHEIKNILAEALIKGKGRWADPSYLTRIIFNHMTRGEQGNYAQETTGYGIDFLEPDVNYPIVRVFYPPLSDDPYPYIECDNEIYSIQEFIKRNAQKLLYGGMDYWNKVKKDDPVLVETASDFLLTYGNVH